MSLITKALGRLAMIAGGLLILYIGLVVVTGTITSVTEAGHNPDPEEVNRKQAQQLFERGKKIFRFDTFGDEAFWGDALQLHRAIKGEKLGGVGPGVSPNTALAVGLKVDSRGASALVEARSRGRTRRPRRSGDDGRAPRAGCGRRRQGFLPA